MPSDNDASHLIFCGGVWCEICGDCLACYGGDPCADDGEHCWPRKEDKENV